MDDLFAYLLHDTHQKNETFEINKIIKNNVLDFLKKIHKNQYYLLNSLGSYHASQEIVSGL